VPSLPADAWHAHPLACICWHAPRNGCLGGDLRQCGVIFRQEVVAAAQGDGSHSLVPGAERPQDGRARGPHRRGDPTAEPAHLPRASRWHYHPLHRPRYAVGALEYRPVPPHSWSQLPLQCPGEHQHRPGVLAGWLSVGRSGGAALRLGQHRGEARHCVGLAHGGSHNLGLPGR